MQAKKPTLKSVAAEAGVSIATVSYVLSGRAGGVKGVSEASREAVLAAVDRLGYIPNRAAQAVRTGRTRTIQLSLNMLSDPWSLAVVDAVSREARRAGLGTVIVPGEDWYEALADRDDDAAFVDTVTAAEPDRAKLETLRQRGRQIIVLSNELGPDGYDVIRSDPLQGCRLAVDHLLSLGRDVACLAGARTRESSRGNRHSVYLAALRDAGIAPRAERTAWFENSTSSALTAALGLLSQPNRPSAIYATTDFAAIAAINAARALRLRVPEDVAVTGAGNTPDSVLMSPTLTTAGPDAFFQETARIVVSRAVNPDQDHEVHDFPWTLHIRESTTAGGR